jgi:hypothetical protein
MPPTTSRERIVARTTRRCELMGLGGMWLRIAGAFMKIVILALNEVKWKDLLFLCFL